MKATQRWQFSLRRLFLVVSALAVFAAWSAPTVRRLLEPGTQVQLPPFVFTTVTTTVSLPDAGTILVTGSGIRTDRRQSFDADARVE